MSCINEAYKNVQSATTVSSCDTQPPQGTLFEIAGETNSLLFDAINISDNIRLLLGIPLEACEDYKCEGNYRDRVELSRALAKSLGTALNQIASAIG